MENALAVNAAPEVVERLRKTLAVWVAETPRLRWESPWKHVRQSAQMELFLQSMPEPDATILRYRHLDKLEPKEIAERMGIGVKAVNRTLWKSLYDSTLRRTLR